jgi:hypothetical protein
VPMFESLENRVLLSAPPNDNFSAAAALSGSSASDTGTNAEATGETGEPDHSGDSDPLNSVWWNWTAPSDGLVVVDTHGSDFDTTLGVYIGSAVDNLIELGSSTGGFRVFFAARAGSVYRIAVDGYADSTGSIALNLNLTPWAANDDFADAATLTGSSDSDTANNFASTGEIGEPDHASASSPRNSLWWKWTAPSTGGVVIDTFGSDFNTTLAVYTGATVNALTEVASNNNYAAGSSQSRVSFQAVASTTYYIAVDGAGEDTGNISLNLLVDTTPPKVQSITRGSSDTSLGTVWFDVVFTEPVTGVDNSDFQLVTTGHIKGVSMAFFAPFQLNETTYRIVVSTGKSTGTIRLDLIDNNSIQDIAGNALAGPSGPDGFFQGPVYSFPTGRRLR